MARKPELKEEGEMENMEEIKNHENRSVEGEIYEVELFRFCDLRKNWSDG